MWFWNIVLRTPKYFIFLACRHIAQFWYQQKFWNPKVSYNMSFRLVLVSLASLSATSRRKYSTSITTPCPFCTKGTLMILWELSQEIEKILSASLTKEHCQSPCSRLSSNSSLWFCSAVIIRFATHVRMCPMKLAFLPFWNSQHSLQIHLRFK